MPRPGYDDVILVTGFPSLYGRKMVEHILANEPRALVYTIVPGRLEPEAKAVIGELPGEQRDRVVMIEGDAVAMDLGLSGAEFRQLSRELDRIHHVAFASHVGIDRRTAETINVGGTAEILELGRACEALQCLTLHSTALVSGDRTGIVYEDELECGQSFRSAIEATRMRAEVIARRAIPKVPIAVVRPTTIVGDSGYTEAGSFDGPYLLVLLILATPAEIAIPLPGKGEAPFNVVPIDFVIRASHAIGRHPSAPGGTFHIADPHPLSARHVFDLVAKAGGRRAARGYMPSNLAKALLRMPGIERFVRSPRAFVEQLSSAVRYDTRNADRVLADAGIACPGFESYVESLVAVVQERIRSRGAKRETETEVEVDDPLS